MWYQLGLFGSRVVEAVSVGATSEDKGAGTPHEKVTVVEADSAEKEPEEDRAYGEHEKVTEADSAEKEPEEDRAYGEAREGHQDGRRKCVGTDCHKNGH
jgi:hypothetical protein